MIMGCYSLHLYCDNYSQSSVGRGEHAFLEFPHEFTAELGSTCRKEAKEMGWTFNRQKDIAVCPKCNKRKALKDAKREDKP
jgi:hypothetical protein